MGNEQGKLAEGQQAGGPGGPTGTGLDQVIAPSKMNSKLQQKFARGVQYNMKVVIRGDTNTGKTALLTRLQGGGFVPTYEPTPAIQAATIKWNYKVTNDIVKVEVWDVVDHARKKGQARDSLKLTNDTTEEGDGGPALDATFVDVYKGAHGAIIVVDITKPWTWQYAQREVPLIPKAIPVLILANKRDLWQQRQVRLEEMKVWVEHMAEEREIDFAEGSMADNFGLQFLYTYLSLPFLRLQRETLLRQLEVNEKEIAAVKTELKAHATGPKQDYAEFLRAKQRKSDGSVVSLPATTPGQPSDEFISAAKTTTGAPTTPESTPATPIPAPAPRTKPNLAQPQSGGLKASPGVDPLAYVPSDFGKDLDDFLKDVKEPVPAAAIPKPVTVDSDEEDNPLVAKLEDFSGDHLASTVLPDSSEDEEETKKQPTAIADEAQGQPLDQPTPSTHSLPIKSLSPPPQHSKTFSLDQSHERDMPIPTQPAAMSKKEKSNRGDKKRTEDAVLDFVPDGDSGNFYEDVPHDISITRPRDIQVRHSSDDEANPSVQPIEGYGGDSEGEQVRVGTSPPGIYRNYSDLEPSPSMAYGYSHFADAYGEGESSQRTRDEYQAFGDDGGDAKHCSSSRSKHKSKDKDRDKDKERRSDSKREREGASSRSRREREGDRNGEERRSEGRDRESRRSEGRDKSKREGERSGEKQRKSRRSEMS
eukprot:comp23212_c0_seq1/m.37783 comp23212_c0_seq1/g.37783  ORF comp23212_c0_seq1/g.37783 comp23212_c0_seq1/m.37783 type:complete len:703 (-) comp23212_c0_seq1:410-2518(-)